MQNGYLLYFASLGLKIKLKGGEYMSKQSNKEFNNKNKPLPKVDVEFGGDNGLEDKALKAQQKWQKK
jgi:hypothetical protein